MSRINSEDYNSVNNDRYKKTLWNCNELIKVEYSPKHKRELKQKKRHEYFITEE